MKVFLLIAFIFSSSSFAAEMPQTVLGVILNKDRRHDLFEQAKKAGMLAYRIDHNSILKKDHFENVRVWDGKTWKRIAKAPLPTVTYDYSFYRNHPKQNDANKLIKKIYSLGLPKINPTVVLGTLSNKLKFSELMTKSHLNHPETIEYSEEYLEKALRKWDLIYLKPYNGNQSRGIIVIKKNDDGILLEFDGPKTDTDNTSHEESETKEKRYEQLITSHDFEEILAQINDARSIMSTSKSRYLIQEGQKFFQFEGKRTNFRATVQRGQGGQLECTALTVKIGGNVALGGFTASVDPLLKGISETAEQTVSTLKSRLKNAAVETCLEMEKYHGIKIGELGIDLGMLPDGRVIIIEANTKPGYIYYRPDFYKYFNPYEKMVAMQAEEPRDAALIDYAQYLSQMHQEK